MLLFIAIRETYPISQKVHIILDGASYYRSELVKDWAYVMNIDFHYLPPYKPESEPDRKAMEGDERKGQK
ncbi:hypothetical protein BB987_16225 [Photorhabdus temperata]|nr:hypothetical protein BB987_16225 [Photorhabdus temperata]